MQRERSLADAFLEDHRHLTQGLTATLKALEQDDLKTAVRTAEELDQAVGPHIRFEEEFFYPEVAKRRGADYVTRLQSEHEAGRSALRVLLTSGTRGLLSPEDKTRIVAGLREALDHAVSCGTLLSHVTTLESERQRKFLDQLLHLREEGGRWTEHGTTPRDRRGAGECP